MRDVLIMVFAEFLYFQNYQILTFPEVCKFWKHDYLKIVQVSVQISLKLYISWLKCLTHMYLFMHVYL